LPSNAEIKSKENISISSKSASLLERICYARIAAIGELLELLGIKPFKLSDGHLKLIAADDEHGRELNERYRKLTQRRSKKRTNPTKEILNEALMSWLSQLGELGLATILSEESTDE
jgi:hypothetical protein